VTVTVAVPLCPSLVAVITVEPVELALTNPLPLTVATPELLLVQVMVRPVSRFPFASFAVAVNCCVPPTVRLAVAGLTVTEATAGFETEMEPVPLWPSLVAVTVAAPAVLAPTSPLPLTLATPELLLVQVTARPVSAFPFASFGVAMSCCVPPTVRLAVAGLTVTEATGTFDTEMEAVPL